MNLQISTAMKAGMLAAFKPMMDGGYIEVFSGIQPTNGDMANTGALLGTVTREGLPPGYGIPARLFYEYSPPYIVQPYNARWTLAVVNSGVATWFRCYGAVADDGSASYTKARFDGDVTVLSGDGCLRLPAINVTAGDVITPLSFFFTIPPIVGA